MATLTIRDLDDSLKLKLRLRAAGQNRSMEEEARQILRAALLGGQPQAESGAFVARMRERFAGLGDVQLPIEPREPVRSPLEIHEPPAVYAVPAKRGRAATGSEPRAPRKKRAP